MISHSKSKTNSLIIKHLIKNKTYYLTSVAELQFKVKAVSINPLDWKKLEGQLKIITGSKFPKGIAFDFAGVVEKKGDAVANFKVGDAVFGALEAMKGEALAEYIVVSEASIYKKPVTMSFETAAAMVSIGAAALYLFQNAPNAKAGSNILINGASGGVGMVVLQMAKSKSMKVTAVASGAGLDYIKKWQPDTVIDYKKDNILAQKVAFDAIFELSGSLSFSKAKSFMKPNTFFVSTLPNPIDMLKGFFNNLWSSKKHKTVKANPTQENYRELCEWVTNKGLDITIAKTFSMPDFKEAYQFAKKGGIVGKIVFSF
jgi:NADPH:quinone reductase-like Zn-dependent oxidoreductase